MREVGFWMDRGKIISVMSAVPIGRYCTLAVYCKCHKPFYFLAKKGKSIFRTNIRH